MQSIFSLNDTDVRRLVADAASSSDINLLRSHLYRLVNLRKEMGIAIREQAQNRNDLARIVQTAQQVLAEDRSTGLLSLLDRKGLISGYRTKLKAQLEANQALANTNADLRNKISSAAQAVASSQALRDQVGTLTRQLADLQAANQQALQQLEFARQDAASRPEALAAETPQNGPDEALLLTIQQQEATIAELQRQLDQAQSTLQDRHQAQAAAATQEAAASTPEIDQIRDMFAQQVSGYMADNLRLTRELRTTQETVDQLKGSLGQVEELLATANQENADGKELAAALQQQLDAAVEQRAGIEQMLSQREEAITLLQQQLEDARSALQSSEQNAAAIQTKLEGAMADITRQAETISSLTQDKDQLLEQVAELGKQNGLSQAQVAELQENIRNHIGQIEAIQHELDTTIQNWQESQTLDRQKIQDQSQEISRQSTQLEQLSATNLHLERHLGMLENRTERLLSIKQGLEASLKAGAEERQRLTALAKDTSYELLAAQRQNKALEATVQQQQSLINDLSSRLQTEKKVIHLAGPAARRAAEVEEEVPEFELPHQQDETPGHQM